MHNSAIDWNSPEVEVFPLEYPGISFATFIAKVCNGVYLVGTIPGYGKPCAYIDKAETVSNYSLAVVLQEKLHRDARFEFARYHGLV